MKKKLSLSPQAFNVLASLLLTSMLGMPFAGYDLKTAGIVFIIHSSTYACLTADSRVKDSEAVHDDFDII